MKIKNIALLVGLLPLVAVNASYLISASYGHVDWCIPFIDGCTSISGTGRKIPESFVFKSLMISSAVIMMAYWKVGYEWLRALGDEHYSRHKVMLYLGIVAAIFLIVYTTALGVEGHIYRFYRRTGVIIYFSFTYLSQLLFTSRLLYLSKSKGVNFPYKIPSIQYGICVVLLVIGLLSIWASEFDRAENAVEWIFAAILHLYFFTTYLLWRADEFQANFSVNYNLSPKYKHNDK